MMIGKRSGSLRGGSCSSCRLVRYDHLWFFRRSRRVVHFRSTQEFIPHRFGLAFITRRWPSRSRRAFERNPVQERSWKSAPAADRSPRSSLNRFDQMTNIISSRSMRRSARTCRRDSSIRISRSPANQPRSNSIKVPSRKSRFHRPSISRFAASHSTTSPPLSPDRSFVSFWI